MIPVMSAEICGNEVSYVSNAAKDGELSGRGKYVKIFEESLAKYLGVKYAVCTPSGTTALHLALHTAGVGWENEVILPQMTIQCCIFPVTQQNAQAILIDVNKNTWCMESKKVLEVLRKKQISAIMPVHMFGMMCDIQEIVDTVKKFELSSHRKICVIEDACEALGSTYKGKFAGTFGDMGCFSFFYNKNITGGELGAVVTNNDYLNERLRFYRDLGYGNTYETKFFASDLAFNYRPNGLACAFALGQLENIDYLLKRRQDINKLYRQYLVPKFIWQTIPEGYFNSYWAEIVLLPEGTRGRDAFIAYMRDNGIETRPAFPPLCQQIYLINRKIPGSDMYAAENVGDYKNSQYIWDNVVMLPSSGKGLDEKTLFHISNLANKFLLEK